MVDYEEKYIEFQEKKDSPTSLFKNIPIKAVIVIGLSLMFFLIYYSITSGQNISPWMIVGIAAAVIILVGMKSQADSGLITREEAEAILYKRINEDMNKDDSDLPEGKFIISLKGKLIDYKPERWMIAYCITDKNFREHYYYGFVDAGRNLGYLGSREMPTGIIGDEGADSYVKFDKKE